MATKVTESAELLLELANGAGDATRTLKIENPDTETYTTKAEVEEVISAAFFPATDSAGTTRTGFFCDDADSSVPLTVLKSVSYVITRKEVTEYA